MSTVFPRSAASPAIPVEVSAPLTKRRIDRIDEPARPLGAKRAALQVRRQLASQPYPCVNARIACIHAGEVILASKDNSVAFSLRGTAVGLLIKRTQQRTVGARLVQTMVFADPTTFERWCASEPIRFDDPVLYDKLRRDCHEALSGIR